VIGNKPHILLINPWIHDFAAYDFWAKPLGLLSIAGILRHHGFDVDYVDCLNRFHPKLGTSRKQVSSNEYIRNGRGPYLKTPISKPEGLGDIPRTYSRYGIRPEWFLEDLNRITPPNLILITSLMTYWYGGVRETASIAKSVFPNTPILAGGIYTTLCPEHAGSHLGVDDIFSGPAEEALLDLVAGYTGYSPRLRFDPDVLDSYPYPAFDLQGSNPYGVIMTSRGCPFSCAYCASKLLMPKRMTRSAESVVEELRYWHGKYGFVDYALYDDAFLIGAETHAMPVLEKIISSGLPVRFHTPNALHVREINTESAVLMKRAGFYTIRLGLETASFSDREALDKKVKKHQFQKAVSSLKSAGFEKKQIGAYLLVGLPFENQQDILESIDIVKASGITPVLAYYSPIPGTSLWEKAVSSSRYDLLKDPVFTNNSIFPCRKTPFSWDFISELKKLVAC
jgi:hypothetical protein